MDGGKVMPAEKSETVATPQTHCESPSERTEEIARPLAALISSRGCPFYWHLPVGDGNLLPGGFRIAGPLEFVKEFSRTFSFQVLRENGAEMSFHTLLSPQRNRDEHHDRANCE